MGWFVRGIDVLSEWSGRAVCWLALLLVLVTAYETGQRYLFRQASTALQELTWHIYSVLFLLGFAYTLKHDGHVRVDIFYDRMSPRVKALVNLFSMVFLLVPFCLLMIWLSWDWVVRAYEIGERSGDPGGLPARWVLKAMIPVGFGLLVLQGLGEIVRNLRALRGSATDCNP